MKMKPQHKFAAAVAIVTLIHLGSGILGLELYEPESGIQYWFHFYFVHTAWIFLLFDVGFEGMGSFFNFFYLPMNSFVFAMLVCAPVYYWRKREDRRGIAESGRRGLTHN